MPQTYTHSGALASPSWGATQIGDSAHAADVQEIRRSNRIQHLREQAGLSRPELAAKMECSVSQLRKLERGERQLDTDWMRRVARALKRREAELLNSEADFEQAMPVVDTGEPILVEVYRTLPRALQLKLIKEALDLRQNGSAEAQEPDARPPSQRAPRRS